MWNKRLGRTRLFIRLLQTLHRCRTPAAVSSSQRPAHLESHQGSLDARSSGNSADSAGLLGGDDASGEPALLRPGSRKAGIKRRSGGARQHTEDLPDVPADLTYSERQRRSGWSVYRATPGTQCQTERPRARSRLRTAARYQDEYREYRGEYQGEYQGDYAYASEYQGASDPPVDETLVTQSAEQSLGLSGSGRGRDVVA